MTKIELRQSLLLVMTNDYRNEYDTYVYYHIDVYYHICMDMVSL